MAYSKYTDLPLCDIRSSQQSLHMSLFEDVRTKRLQLNKQMLSP